MKEWKRLHERVITNIQKNKEGGEKEEAKEGIKDNEPIEQKESLHKRSAKKLELAKKEVEKFLEPSTDRTEKWCEDHGTDAYESLKAFNIKDDRSKPGRESSLSNKTKYLIKGFERGLIVGEVFVDVKKAIRNVEDYIETLKSFIEEIKTNENNPQAQKNIKNAKAMLVGLGKKAMKNNDPEIAKQVFDYTGALEGFPVLEKIVGAQAKQAERLKEKRIEQEEEEKVQVSRDKGYVAYMALSQEKPQENDPFYNEINHFNYLLKIKWLSMGYSGLLAIKKNVGKPEDYVREVEQALKERQSDINLNEKPAMKQSIEWLKGLLEGTRKAAEEKGDKEIKNRIDEILGKNE